MSRADVITLLYIVAFSLFITGLHMLRGPRTAVRGNQVAAVGMAIAVIATLIDQRIGDWGLIVVGLVRRDRPVMNSENATMYAAMMKSASCRKIVARRTLSRPWPAPWR